MNKNMEALAKQAAEYAIEFSVNKPELYIPMVMEKFAQMIVRECMELGDKALQDGEWPGDRLKEHFGVEE